MNVSKINNEEIEDKLILINLDPSKCFYSIEETIEELGISTEQYFDLVCSPNFQRKALRISAATVRSKMIQVATATSQFALLEKNAADRKLMFQAAGLLEDNINVTLNSDADATNDDAAEARRAILDQISAFSVVDDNE